MAASAIFVMLSCSTAKSTLAQTSNPTVYLESHDEFANDFAAGVIRKGVPVTLTTDRHQAGYVVRFTWATNEGSKTQGVMTALMTGVYMNGAYERVSMSILERKSKNLIYSYTCQKGGRHTQSVAECLAKHWKDAIDDKRIVMKQFGASELADVSDNEAETISVRKAGDTLPSQIVEHPVPPTTPVSTLQNNIIEKSAPPTEPESVAEASRRLKAEKNTQQTKPQP